MRRKPSWPRKVAGVVCGVVAVASLVGNGQPARAQEIPTTPTTTTSSLGGYQGTAQASGLHVFYTPEGALPIGSLIDVGAPDALATIASGPSTFARASAADPGDLLANPDVLFTLAAPGYPQGTIPAYPYRATATSGFGEPAMESSPAPGLSARAEVEPDSATATATMPRADAPAIATFGTMSSVAETSTDGSSVTVHVRTEVSGFKLLDVLAIDSIVTDLTATSSGGGAVQMTGGTSIAGATVQGQPVTIDGDGVHQGDGASGPALGDAIDPLNQALEAAGIRVTLSEPVQDGGTTAGQLASAGLRIDLVLSASTVPGLSDVLGNVPSLPGLAPGAPTVDDLVVAAEARHVTRLEVGRGAVTLSARPRPAPISFARPTLPTTGAVTPVAAPSLGNLAPIAAPAISAPAGGATTPVAATPTAALPEVPLGAGIGALAILLFLAQPLAGIRMAGMADTVLAAGPASCPREGR